MAASFGENRVDFPCLRTDFDDSFTVGLEKLCSIYLKKKE